MDFCEIGDGGSIVDDDIADEDDWDTGLFYDIDTGAQVERHARYGMIRPAACLRVCRSVRFS